MSEDSTFEREKWLADLELRKRELKLKEREQRNRNIEVAIRKRELRVSPWTSPLTVAVFAAAAAATGNAVVTLINGSMQRGLDGDKQRAEIALERAKAESTRILEMIKTGDSEKAAINLEFLMQSGLITDPALSLNIQRFLKARRPGTGPSLPSPTGRVEFEQSNLLSDSLQRNLQNEFDGYFEYLDRIGFPRPKSKVTVKVESMDSPNAYYIDGKIVVDPRMATDPSVPLREYNHHLLIAGKSPVPSPDFAALESGVADYLACSYLNNPNMGEKSARLFELKTPYIRRLSNTKTYTELTRADVASFPYIGAEVWGGLFWSIRQKLGAREADSLIASAWSSFNQPSMNSQTAPVFLVSLLSAARSRDPQTLDLVRTQLTERKFPQQ